MADLLWLEPTRTGRLPPTSVFLASRRSVRSTFVLGTLDPAARRQAYERLVKVLLERVKGCALKNVRVEHSRLSAEIVGSAFSIYAAFRMPKDLLPVTTFAEILAEQEILYHGLEHQDKLKLIFQAVYGGEHMLRRKGTAWQQLCQEWDLLEATFNEPLAERISPEGDLYHINLRPAKELGIDLEKLSEAVERSAERIREEGTGREGRLLPQARSAGIEPDEVLRKPIHHSASYKERVRPAYRLIHAADIGELLQLAD